MQPDKAGCLQGPLTYIVNNCIMHRDSQASCCPFNAQMGETFPSSFCMPPAEQRLDQESGVSACSLWPSSMGAASLLGAAPCLASSGRESILSAKIQLAAPKHNLPRAPGASGQASIEHLASKSFLPRAAPHSLRSRLIPTVSFEFDRVL